MKSSPEMTIGELAARHGLGTHVLRHWEDMGLLTPRRTSTGRRVYGPADATRIGLILLGKDAGLSLEQTRQLLTAAGDRDARSKVYERHVAGLRQRIAAAQASLDIIEHAAQCTAEDITTCPDLHAKLVRRGLIAPAAAAAEGPAPAP